jgi:hypothetical protein
MSNNTHPVTVILITTIIAAALLIPATGASTAQEHPQTAEEYFNTLRGMGELGVLSEYGELDTVHTQSLAAVQIGDFTDNEAAELNSVISTIRLFQTAQDQFEAGDYQEAFKTADDIEGNISELTEHDESLGVLSELALTRYYEALGNELAGQADEANNTAIEIDRREMAAQAYKGANSPEQAAEFTRQVEELKSKLRADRERMSRAETAMGEFSQSCSDGGSAITAITGNGVGNFGKYRTAVKVQPRVAQAEQLAARHGLDDREAALSEQASSASTYRSSLAVAATFMMIGYGLIAGLVTLFVVSRLFRWKRTFDAAEVDSIVVMGDHNV